MSTYRQVHWGVRYSDGRVARTGPDLETHSGRWLAEQVLRHARTPPTGFLTLVPECGGPARYDPGAVLVRSVVVTHEGPWEVLEPPPG